MARQVCQRDKGLYTVGPEGTHQRRYIAGTEAEATRMLIAVAETKMVGIGRFIAREGDEEKGAINVGGEHHKE